MKDVLIIGAGLAGLIAANMLRKRFAVTVFEKQPELPNNHSALLRFRSDAVSRETGIPFRKVKVHKSVHGSTGNPFNDAIRYCKKVSPDARLELRSAFNLEPITERFIAPPDLIARLAEGPNIKYEKDFEQLFDANIDREVPVISTVPMRTLMKALKYPGPQPKFEWVPGCNYNAELDADLFATVYCPSTDDVFYRVSITGNQLIAESLLDMQNVRAFSEESENLMRRYFDIYVEPRNGRVKLQAYSKINYLSETDRRYAETFQMWASVNHNIFSLGRFATWRAGLLLDDLVQDVHKIANWIEQGSFTILKGTG